MSKIAPLSLRIPAVLRLLVEQWASVRGVPRNAAYVDLIQRGLATVDLKGVIPARQAKGTTPKPPKADKGTTPAKPFVTRLKGQWKAP